jgi:hypothetical protein
MNTKNPAIYKVSHFTPAAKACWCWLVLIPAITLTGRQSTITGETVDVVPARTLWTALPGSPSFPSREAAARWAELMQLPNVVSEI